MKALLHFSRFMLFVTPPTIPENRVAGAKQVNTKHLGAKAFGK
jgi:hypothetical protein